MYGLAAALVLVRVYEADGEAYVLYELLLPEERPHFD